MEGTHQRHSNWYRCRLEQNRGAAAAQAAGHPRALQIKESLIVGSLLDFMGRRLFGLDRLRLLRAELFQAGAATWRKHDDELNALKR
jgi:hypothetical protein